MQDKQKRPSFPCLPKSALFSKLDAFLPLLAEENKKLVEAVAARKGSKHNIEVEETEEENGKSAIVKGDAKEEEEKAPVIEMNFALAMMDENGSDNEDASATSEVQIKAARTATVINKGNVESREQVKETSFQMRLEKSSGKPRPWSETKESKSQLVYSYASMFYQLSQKLSKGSMMAITIPTIIAASYTTFAFFRYTGMQLLFSILIVCVCNIHRPDLGGELPGSPKTTSAEWRAASVEYGKAQKGNPIRHFKD
ncbi:hypothetical protein PsorP6_007418 [Peronosclerospora sorghi]|uniref:Uncharacterized protein n=1 Tax=Peronosclerospora sorghi TaxID=230839 RepID=A0ACC0W8H4_9STRA|nr:hypothetical protein PsorP6_007418 [Peronosclerospora sorghi]